MAITIPAKRTGPKVRTSAEECLDSIQMCEQSVGTRYAWGRGAILRRQKDCEAFGVKVSFVEAKG